VANNFHNNLLVPIKFGTCKFSSYLILIVFLVPTKKKLLLILVLDKTKFVKLSLNSEIFERFFLNKFRTL